MSDQIKTRHTHPQHQVVGQFFTAWNEGQQVYYCDSYDPSCGFWMTNINNPADRRNVSERAPGRTYHQVYDFEDAKRERLGITDQVADTIEQRLKTEQADGWSDRQSEA